MKIHKLILSVISNNNANNPLGNWLRRCRSYAGLAGAVLAAVLVSSTPSHATGITWLNGELLPTFSAPAPVLDCLDVSSSSGAEADLFASLEGIVNRTQPQIACVSSSSGEGEFSWLILHHLKYNVLTNNYTSLTKYKSYVTGLVVNDTNVPDTLNLATTIAGVKNELICAPALLSTLTNAPYSFVINDDLRGKFTTKYSVYNYLYSNYWSQCTHHIVAGLETNLDGNLRDYLVAVQAATVWLDPGTSQDATTLAQFVSNLPANKGVYIGWWPNEGNGLTWIANYGIPTLASDFYQNGSVFSGCASPINVPNIPPPPPLQKKIYIAFILSDGDNVQYMQHVMNMDWNEPARGQLPISWTAQALTADIDPGMLNFYWSTATTNDCLVSGPSGAGYAHVELWSSTNLTGFTQLSSGYLQRSGLRIVTVWDSVNSGVAQAYATNCPSLLGLTDQAGSYNAVNFGLRTMPENPTYPSLVSQMTNAIIAATNGWNGSAPLFIAAQADVWGIDPNALLTIANMFQSSNIQFVRADHLFMLANGIASPPVLQHRYSFVSDASDSVGGTAWKGTLVAPGGGSAATISGGLNLPGNTHGGFGYSGYVSLPAGILTNTASLTVECWAKQTQANSWAEVWDFANSSTQNFGLIPDPANNGNHLEVAYTPNSGEIDSQSALTFPNGSEQYVAVTYNSNTLTGCIYTNGALVATTYFPNASYTPGTIGGSSGTSENMLGNDTYGDDQFAGTVYEYRIWNGTVTPAYLAAAAAAGPSVVVTNTTPSSLSLSLSTTSMTVGGTQHATVTGNLPQVSGVNLTIAAINWVSSNPGVLAVNSSGLVTAVSGGQATVSATVNGVTATSASVTVSAVLQHRYSFVSDASDSVGGATWNGTLVAPSGGSAATISSGLNLPGNTHGGFGYSGYVSLPAGILTNTASLTVECWVKQTQANTWAEVWDFANSSTQNFGLIPYPANNSNHMEVAFTPNSGELDVTSSLTFPNGSEQYVAVTYNSNTLTGSIYTNGALVATTYFPNASYTPGTIGGSGGTSQNMLGNDTYGDDQFAGTVYEYRIWNGTVSPAYLAAATAAGPSVVVTNTTPSSLSLSLSTTSMTVGGTQQATVTGNLPQVSGVNLTAAAINWVSSNPGVLAVSSSGLITAVSGGQATVSTTVNGVTATSASVTVSAVLQHRYSFVSDASDSVGGAAWNGTLVAPNGGSAASINNGLSLPGNTHGGFGYSGYVSFPAGILTNTASLTVECWVKQTQANVWAEVWDFADDSSENFGLIPYPGDNNGDLEAAFTPDAREIDVTSSLTFPNGAEQYVALTYNAGSLVGNLYTNGALVATTYFPNAVYTPGTIGGSGGTTQDMLGNDTYGDDQFAGTVYEFRLWSGALSQAYLAAAAAAGPSVVITNTTPSSLSLSLSTTSMTAGGTQQAGVTGNFPQVSGVNLTAAATNWVSSNPGVLTVSSSGLISAVTNGSATISATVNGVTGTSSLITVSTSPLAAPIVKPRFTGVVSTNAKTAGYTLAFTGLPATSYTVWASTNMVDWVPIGTGSETQAGEYEFTDSSTTNYSCRFYRISAP